MFSSEEKAFFAPFAAFLAFLALTQFIGGLSAGLRVAWWWSEPRFWVFPLQTLVCGVMVARWWRFYDLRPPARLGLTLLIAVIVLLLWIAPQVWFGAAPRVKDGFDPTFFGTSGPAYWTTVILRFIRLVIVVPLVEEIFWRGFLLRFFISQPFTDVPIGTFSWRSFAIVTVGFCLIHQPSDWPAATACGMLYNLVAYRTRSLSSCVLAHAVTNLLLGLWIMRTGQWGFW